MITKMGSLLKMAMSPEVKQALKTDAAFRKAYQEFINRAGGSGADVEDLFKNFYAKANGSGVGGGGNWEQNFKQSQQQRQQHAQQASAGAKTEQGFKSKFWSGSESRRAQGFKSPGIKGSVFRGLGNIGAASLGGLGAYSAYKYFRDRKAA